MSERFQYEGHEIHIYNPDPPLARQHRIEPWKFVVELDGQLLKSVHRKLRVFTTLPGARSAARRATRHRCRHTRAREAQTAGVFVCPDCSAVFQPRTPERLKQLRAQAAQLGELDFQIELYVAHAPHGKYVINVNYKGRPIGNDPASTFEQTEFLPYFHRREGSPRCEFLHAGPKRCTSYQDAVECCQRHARGELTAAAPTAPEADA